MASDALQKTQLVAAVEAWLASMTAPVAGLFKDAVVPSPTTDLSTLIVPVGTWYTPIAVTYGQVFENPDGTVEVRCASVQFNYTGSSTGETIRGWTVYDPGSPDVYYHARALDVPVLMANTLDSVIVYPGLIFAPIPQS